MRFADIKGNDTAIAALRSMVASSRVPHALLLYENPSSGGLALACAWVQYLNCEHPVDGDSCGECPSCRQMAKLVHPDVQFIFPVNTGTVIKGTNAVSEMGIDAFRQLFQSNPYFTEQDLYDALGIDSKSGAISVAEAKGIISKLSLTSLTGGYKAVVMFLPERMNPQAANKLLKILEEPPAKTVFVLVTQSPEDVMGTIFSRCQGMRVLPFDRSQLVVGKASEDVAAVWDQLLSALSSRNLLAALEAGDAVAALASREKQKAFCAYASEQIRKAFLCSHGLQDIAYSDGPVPSFSTKFCFKAVQALDNASMLIGRNVAAKIVFTDLVNRLYVNL